MDKQNLLDQLEEAIKDPEGKESFRYVLNVCGSLPFVGGAISGLGSWQAEVEQHRVNQILSDISQMNTADIETIADQLREVTRQPGAADFIGLVEKVFGADDADKIFQSLPARMRIVLHPSTLDEFETFIERGWVQIASTGSVCLMGAGNSVGNDYEDKKRPWGNGDEFVLTILGIPC